MVIGRDILDEVIADARAGFPNEACGMLASEDGRIVKFYPIRNSAESPVFYEMDSGEQLRAMLDMDDQGWDLGIIYHSHTRTRAFPSATDVNLAGYPDALYMIVSLAREDAPDVRAYRIVEGEISEEQLVVED